MQLILTQDVEHLGKAGDLVKVKSGFARNYLLPQRKAVSADARNKARFEHERRRIAKEVAKHLADAESTASRINGMTLQFERKTAEEKKLFGSVTARDLARQLEVAGVIVEASKITLAEPVRALGKYEAPVKLGSGVVATLKFWVVPAESATE